MTTFASMRLDACLAERAGLLHRQSQCEGLLGDLLRTYSDGSHGDIDGCEVQELLAKWHFTKVEKVSAEVAEESWAIDYDIQEGDDAHIYQPIMREVLRNDKD